MRHMWIGVILSIAVGSTLWAHSGVTNRAVMNRMNGMTGLQEATAVLGKMIKGETPFDATSAGAARDVLIDQSNAVPDLFRAPEMDPKAEADPRIWSNWEGFLARNDQMLAAAQALDTQSLQGLRTGMAALGQSCQACHSQYRITR